MIARALIASTRGGTVQRLLEVLLEVPVEPLLCESGAMALTLCARHRPDILVLDLKTLPGTAEGISVGVRALEPPPLLVAILAENDNRLRPILAERFDAVLLDPFDLEISQRLLRRLWSQRLPWKGPEYHAFFQRLVRGLAHRLRTSMQLIGGQIALLTTPDRAQGPPERTEGSHAMEAVRKEIDQILAWVQALESYGRSHKPPNRRWIAWSELSQTSQSDPLLIESVSPSSEPRQILADKDWLRAALGSLVKFVRADSSPPGVRLSVSFGNQRVEVEIRGQRRFVLPHPPLALFLPFHDILGAAEVGGLELSAAYGVIRGHGGDLEPLVDDLGYLRFRISIPIPNQE